MEAQETNEGMSMAEQAAMNKKNKIAKANGEAVDELPKGAAPVKAEAEVAEEAPAEEGSVADALGTGEEAAPVMEAAVEEEPIRIAGKTFKNQKEALEYAEKLEQEKLIAEAHAQGVREALAANAPAAVTPVVEEEDFDTKFYSNPKETLREMQVRARDEAVAMIRAETAKEKAWNDFLSEFPDIRRQDAENVLNQHAKTIGILPWEDGKKALASAVYREYDEIANLRKPKTELSARKPALSPSGGAPRGVTPKAADEKPLSFLDQVRKVKTKG